MNSQKQNELVVKTLFHTSESPWVSFKCHHISVLLKLTLTSTPQGKFRSLLLESRRKSFGRLVSLSISFTRQKIIYFVIFKISRLTEPIMILLKCYRFFFVNDSVVVSSFYQFLSKSVLLIINTKQCNEISNKTTRLSTKVKWLNKTKFNILSESSLKSDTCCITYIPFTKIPAIEHFMMMLLPQLINLDHQQYHYFLLYL